MIDAGGVAERAFFREEFRHRTLVIAVRDAVGDVVLPLARELLAGDCRVVVVLTNDDAASDRLATSLGTVAVPAPESHDTLASLWMNLEDTGVRVVGVDGDPAGPAAALAGRLGVFKLVVTDAAGGWGRSFASLDDLDADATTRPLVAEAIRDALENGVGGVNVCRAEDLDIELFTFDGAGTLFTADAYVQVTPLRADDLGVVEQLAARGVAEGFLRPRPRVEVVRLALGGLGARVGPSRHLAGFGTLEVDRYPAANVAEVTCLYTVNRYEGEGVGGQLVDGLVQAARRAGFDAVFACTVSSRAAALFERSGFRGVDQGMVPEEKWVGYDASRRQLVSAHWFDLEPAGAAEVCSS
ncbi:MAG TPA: GNAT family N-acetyltransferase [Acidimicrobiales bacterium]|nr:GNAT family N-acetyltransferase [Acidimicrobiales bacterium]